MVEEKDDEIEREEVMETESMKVSKVSDDEDRERLEKEMEKESSIKINYKSMEIGLMGFNVIKNDNGDLVFGFKIKEKERNIIYYIPNDLNEVDKKNAEEFKEMVEIVAKDEGFNMENVMEVVKNIYLNKKMIEDKCDVE